MFGYIRTDEPYLYKKDEVLYGAVYCGLCKAIGSTCGQMARFGLTYDVAFLSVMLHNLSDTDVKIEKKRCVAHWFKRRNIAKVDQISLMMGAFNTILCYYKGLDDYNDTGKRSVKSRLFSKGYKRAKKEYPQLDKLVEKCFEELDGYEKKKLASPDIVADPFSKLSSSVAKFALGEKCDENIEKAFYFLGKWIYLIDALDDYEKDVKSGNYNVYACAYGNMSGKELIEKHKEEIFPVLNSVFYHLKQAISNVRFYFNKDLIENVLLRGIPKQTDTIVKRYLDGGK